MYGEQESIILILNIINILLIIQRYSSHDIMITSNILSLPLKHVIAKRKPDISTVDTYQHLQHTIPKLSINYIILYPHPELYRLSPTQCPKNITTLRIYKLYPTIIVQTNEVYNFDSYLKNYISQHP